MLLIAELVDMFLYAVANIQAVVTAKGINITNDTAKKLALMHTGWATGPKNESIGPYKQACQLCQSLL